jgi:hypothetical protein
MQSLKTPMATNGHLDLDEGGTIVDQKLFVQLLVVCSTLSHIGLMLCLVFAYVLVFKHHLERFT